MGEQGIKYYISPGVMVGNLICSGFSLTGSLFIIILYLRVKKIRSLIYTLIFCISISEAFNSIAHLFSIYNMYVLDSQYVSNPLCKIQTVIIHLTDTSTMIFLCIICFCIISLIKYNNKKLYLKKKLFILLGTLIPVGFTTLNTTLLFTQIIKNNSIQDPYFSWCWLKVKDKNNSPSSDQFENKNIKNYPLIITIVFYWIMIIFIYIVIIQVLLFVKKKQKISQGTELYKKIQNVVTQLYNYPIIGSVCWIFTTLNMILPFYSKQDNTSEYKFSDRIAFLFLTLEGMFCSMRGFFIFIIFISGEKVYEIVMNLVEKFANKLKVINQSQINGYETSSVNNSILVIENEVRKERLFE